MRRAATLILALLAGAVLLVSGTAAGGEDGTYEVRAIFDNAGFLVAGEEVRAAGAKIGTVSEVDVAGADEAAREDGSPAPGKAVVVMRIDDPGFQDFRADASCLIRPQSLIGEKFVECQPTQPRAASSIDPEPLEEIADGEPGEGQLLLPLERNGKAVDLDLVNNIYKEPYPDRFRLILNDLGAGLAARGEELAEIVERANPALRETNEVLAILAEQNDRLAQLASDSDAILGALARDKESVSGFINQSTIAGEATAERSAELEASLQKFPGFLRELRLSMTELRRFSDAATPAFADLRQAAPSLTRVTRDLVPFSNAGTDAFITLGAATDTAGPDLVAADPVIRQVRGLARSGEPATRDVNLFLRTLRKTEGFRYLAELIFNTSGSVNAFDQYGHFLRALLPINNCVDYEVIIEPGCDQSFGLAAPTSAKALERQLLRLLDDGSGGADDSASSPQPDESIGGLPVTPGEPRTGEDSESPLGAEPEPRIPPAPEAAPDSAQPDVASGPRVDMRAARDLLDFLIGDRRARR